MGVQGLLKFVKSVTSDAHIGDYRGRTVAVDASSWLHRGARASVGDNLRGQPTTKWMGWPLRMVQMLKDAKVRPVVVFDGAQLPMKAEHVSLQGWKLQLPGRALLFAGWLRSAPAVTSIDLRECNLTPTEVHSRALTIARYCRDTRDCTL